MPWKVSTSVSLRKEFVELASQDETNIRRLCREFGISAKTGYKWLGRYYALGTSGLEEKSRRPGHSPTQTVQRVEEAILAVRDLHSSWGGRKIARWLHNHKPEIALPSLSTITAILRRNGRIDPAESVKHQPWQRFEAAAPNDMWQIDFKGHFPMIVGRCHPLTLLDDHSRFSPGLYALATEQDQPTRECLIRSFRQYGLPLVILTDNGSPWGSYVLDCRVTCFAAWLIRLGITVSHARPHHPQTKGKNERFNRTLKTEVLQGERLFEDLFDCQSHFDPWLWLYNNERPHEALNMDVPAQHYRRSDREYPEALPPVVYDTTDIVRKVQKDGTISFQNKEFSISKGLMGEYVALRPGDDDGIFNVFYCHQRILKINRREDG